MPSQQHEALLELFRNRPTLAPKLLHDALHVELPPYCEARIDSADLSEVQPAEYRADMVVVLLDEVPKLGIVVEVQLSADARKRFVWPAYVTNLRARLHCPVCLLVVTPDETVARWAREPVELGDGNLYRPRVLGPSDVPEVMDEESARSNPELAVLSVMSHGCDADTGKSARIAAAARMASAELDEGRSRLYLDLIMASVSEAVQRELRNVDMTKYEYQSEFARRYIALGRDEGRVEGRVEGRAEGVVEGRAALVSRQLELRFGSLSGAARTQIAVASLAELDAIGERLLTAKTLNEALDAL